jgi:hypothetical protein
MPLWVCIAAGASALCCASLTFAVALARSARRADEQLEELPELAVITASLRPLSRERSASGRRFFPTPEARRELALIVHEALEAEPVA